MIHQYKLNGYNIVLDVNSGSVHWLDDAGYDIIAMYKDHDKEEVINSFLDKYRDRPDVNREEIKELLADIEQLEEE